MHNISHDWLYRCFGCLRWNRADLRSHFPTPRGVRASTPAATRMSRRRAACDKVQLCMLRSWSRRTGQGHWIMNPCCKTTSRLQRPLRRRAGDIGCEHPHGLRRSDSARPAAATRECWRPHGLRQVAAPPWTSATEQIRQTHKCLRPYVLRRPTGLARGRPTRSSLPEQALHNVLKPAKMRHTQDCKPWERSVTQHWWQRQRRRCTHTIAFLFMVTLAGNAMHALCSRSDSSGCGLK